MTPARRVSTPLLPTLAVAGGGLVVVVNAGRLLYSVLVGGIDTVFNDFYDYWGAAVLLNRGGNPYDSDALAGVLHSAGLHTEVDGGYSYPLLLAQAVRPLALLTPHAAALVFAILSLLALGVAASLILGALQPLRVPLALGGGSLIAAFPPIFGSLYYGQANLLVLLPLALAWRMVSPGPLLAAASAIKVYPAAGFLTYLSRASRESLRQLAFGSAVLLVLVLVPQLGAHGSVLDRADALLEPDTFWTNASVNGWVSRLSLPSQWTTPPLPGLPVRPLVVAVCALLILATLAVLVRTRHAALPGRLALSLCLGVVVAPKNSIWNYAPLIMAIASVWQLWAGRWWPLVLSGMGWLLIEVQSEVANIARDTFYRGGSQMTWLSAMGLYGAVLIGGALAWLLLATPRVPPSGRASRSSRLSQQLP